MVIPAPLCAHILNFYNRRATAHASGQVGAPPKIYHSYDRAAPRGAMFLDTAAHLLTHIVIDGRRITPRSPSAIVKVRLPSMPDLAGDVVRLFYHEQPGHATPQIFAEMLWMEARSASGVAGNPWQD